MPKWSLRLPLVTGKAWGIVAAVPALMLGIAAVCLPAPQDRAAPGNPPSREVFERRIRPLLAAKNPSSCSECHLSGVDLKDYVRPSEAETFAALRAQGMIDLKRPTESRILRFIQKSRPKTPLVTKRARDAEYGAFRDWIVAAANNPKLAAAKPKVNKRSGPAVSNAVIRHTRIDTVVASFERNVWSQEGRCMNCHRPDNPNVQKFGARVAWFVPDDPEATMRKLIAQGDVNVEKPDESLLLLKPLNKVPHGGGVKMLYGDAGYKLFRSWLEDYARSVKGGYRTAEELPVRPTNALVNMDAILNVNGGPAAWADKLLRVDVYPWDEGRNTWAQKPVGTGERGMFGDKKTAATSTNLIMFIVVPDGNPGGKVARTEAIRARLTGGGRYLLKYYCDTEGKLNKDYTLPTDSAAFYQGQQEVTVASWSGGWGNLIKVQIDLARQPLASPKARQP